MGGNIRQHCWLEVGLGLTVVLVRSVASMDQFKHISFKGKHVKIVIIVPKIRKPKGRDTSTPTTQTFPRKVLSITETAVRGTP